MAIILATLLIVFGGIFLFSKKDNSSPTPTPNPTAYLYFWGDGCPHCTNVAKFLETWEGKDKIDLQKYEVWNNRDNAKLMAEKTKVCNLKQSEMGVPTLVTPDGKCLIGDQPIIDLFKSL